MKEEIEVSLEFYGYLRYLCRSKNLTAVIPKDSTLLDLINWLAGKFGKDVNDYLINFETNQLWCYFSLAVNNEVIDSLDLSRKLEDHDEIKFLFPIIGG